MKKLTKEQFIEKANKIHNNKFWYHLTCYINHSTKVCITCPDHGEFWQTPNVHLSGKSCPMCSNNKKMTKIEFINKANKIHNSFYDYSKIFLTNSKIKICITCTLHGDFWQTPSDHLSAKGCPVCKAKKLSLINTSNTLEFIEKAKTIHGDRFDYSKTIYVNAITKVCVICKDHGEFWQTPAMHLQKHGCPLCIPSKGEILIATILDKYNINFEREFKLPEIISNYEYDFYLPESNILIEFHGEQHYRYIPFFHRNGEDDFLKQKTRDILKKDYAYRFKYRFLEFNYKQLKYMTAEQFEEMIVKKLKFIS